MNALRLLSRRLLPVAAALACAASARGQAFDEPVRQALQLAVQDATASLRASRVPAGTPVSCLPLANDRDAYVESQVKVAIGAAGRQVVEGKSDPFWDTVLAEVAWDTRKADMLDAQTLVGFGKLKATKILVYGNVRAAEVAGRRVFVELELHASSVETKEHLWGGTFAKRLYLPGPETITGLVDLPVEVREPMKAQLAARVAQSIEQAAAKLEPIKTVAFVPLAGDTDRYATFMVRDAVSRGRLTPKNLDLNTLGEARALLQDQPVQADALLYGAVRDMSQRVKARGFFSTTWQVTAEVQACIENAATREVLWSDTVTATETYVEEPTTAGKLGKVQAFLQAHPLAWIVPLGLLVLLIVIAKASRVR